MTVTTQARFKRMGGEFHFMCYPQTHLSQSEVQDLFDQAALEVKRIEEKFTDFKESPFNQINANAGKKPTPVDEEIMALIQRAQKISEKTNGLFDISYASLGHLWRAAKKENKTLTDKQRQKAQMLIDYRKIEINETERTVFLPHKDMRIGLGGIGKGYAVDKAFELLKAKGLINFYVNGSGDIRVHSHHQAPRRWKVGIRNPLSSDSTKSAGLVQLSNGALATSGSYVHHNNQSKDEALDHHIINTQTGHSTDDLISVTVLADDAITSDTTATILMNKTSREALNFLNQENLIGILIDKSGKSHLSKEAVQHFGLFV